MKKWYKKTGYAILIFSCLLWVAIPVIPWLGYSKTQIAGIITILIIAGEITFYLSLVILGKSIIEAIKNKLKFWKGSVSESNTPE
jgi:hypothetical protein